VLLFEHAGRERFRRIAGFDRHATLDYDLAEIDGLGVNSMNSAS